MLHCALLLPGSAQQLSLGYCICNQLQFGPRLAPLRAGEVAVRQPRLAITHPIALPLREGFGSVDSVSCFRQLDQCDSPERLVAEIARVLRPGGLLLLTVPNRHVESLLRPWFHVEFQQALDSPDQRLLICTRNKKVLSGAQLPAVG
jgi:SAM-dependent methyltransferase